MLRAWKIGRFFGIDLYVHWTFLLLPVLVVLNQRGSDETNIPLMLGIFSVFGCIVLHEYGHALTARRFGIQTRDITLYVIGGVARLERISEKPWEEFWIAVAGPAVNVAIMMLLVVLALLLGWIKPAWLGAATGTGWMPTAFGWYLLAVFLGNMGLVIFNMAPAFPMDGGRVFRAVLSMWLGHLLATRIAAWVGTVIAIVGGISLAYFLESPMLLVVAFFVLMAGQQELRYVEWKYKQENDEEPVLPVRQGYYPSQPVPVQAHAFVPSNGFIFQPRVAVFVWDNETGKWVKEAGPHTPPRWNEN